MSAMNRRGAHAEKILFGRQKGHIMKLLNIVGFCLVCVAAFIVVDAAAVPTMAEGLFLRGSAWHPVACGTGCTTTTGDQCPDGWLEPEHIHYLNCGGAALTVCTPGEGTGKACKSGGGAQVCSGNDEWGICTGVRHAVCD